MAKIDALRRFFLPCFFPPTATTATAASAAPKKRLSTSLRDDLEISASTTTNGGPTHDQDSPATTPDSVTPKFAAAAAAAAIVAPPRPSKTMVIGTIFGHRRGHVWFCVQQDRLRNKPFLLLEFPILTHQLVNEMRFGLVRIALECNRVELGLCPLRSIPIWAMSCNGRKLGFAARKKAGDSIRSMLKTMQSTTVGAGVMPSGFGFGSGSKTEEVMYMRANYEHVVGSADSESFHLINPAEFPGQELSIFLLRSPNMGNQ
ncbi:protein MIZU-KUSSEI 1-like [Cucurbita pepo subsp. pepo]|uniref:protein MIZU-KUSSEI 1-like n=1 Tax=Cucurbita pepo subsp. pepo TaxID=3664 RepID=UPI000C9D5A3D|nr:protein MIZU-KUSSEI 1-like [Cucurbita pepo subsp. pepo]